MVELGDMTPEDAQDTAEPDPGAVARRYFLELRDITQDPQRKLFDELDPLEQWVVAIAIKRILDRLKRERVDG